MYAKIQITTETTKLFGCMKDKGARLR